MQLLIAHNPDPDSRLPYLLRLPLGGGLVFRTSDTWPRTKALYCYPVPVSEWPADPVLIEQESMRSCVRRGPAIDLVLARGRENRSQIVYTTARGRPACFWQSPRTRKQARPGVTTPTARAGGIRELPIAVDSHERYAYRFSTQQVTLSRRGLPCGDYGLVVDEQLIASVERKSLTDLISSLTGGKLGYAMADLAALPRAAVVVEDRYSQIFAQDRVRPAQVADGLAELQVRWPNVPIVFCETRKLAEEWTYRFLAAARVWLDDRNAAADGDSDGDGDGVGHARPAGPAGAHPVTDLPIRGRPLRAVRPSRGTASAADPSAGPSTAQIRAWARDQGMDVSDRGRLRPEVHQAYRQAHPEPLG